MTTEFRFTFFDCDNHYYEALDAFTRHIEPQYKKRAIQWAKLDGKQRLLVGGRVNRFIPNPTFDPVGKPGALDEYFRGRNPRGADLNALFGDLEPIPPEYRDRDARLAADGRAGHAGLHHAADARGRDGAGAAARPRRRRSPRSARSTAGWTRTGDSPTRSAFSPLPTSRCASPTTPSANSSGRWSATRASS